ncbi:TetR/AcrR family transcriptional regulator [Vibrio sp. SS-MA-C1-2]|uniref:TetR/AcrR family transcriptional regulator n=1 Tax=Vibrio sp. SS-MA-C1-2 TaxID=2908646 RepID=UPI001F38B51A|nr:TetR/AcrR family transcriptional regulator [Vibrio sp. SS-MA-C1-2]UJF19260.1 TetR/AcrR family transcriptional regulator [Vibrio sp. SS-MA-C1-2]
MKTKDRIVQVALDLFNERGERNVTTNHIAASLEMSPGNLYYHFRNKEQIIYAIFNNYAHDLQTHFVPQSNPDETIDGLANYVDAIFLIMWRYRFFYANLPDILSRDKQLKADYLSAQQHLHNNLICLLMSLQQVGFLTLDEGEILTLTNTLKIVASSWVSYQIAHSPTARITEQVINQGVLQILSIVKPITSMKGREKINELEGRYK